MKNVWDEQVFPLISKTLMFLTWWVSEWVCQWTVQGLMSWTVGWLVWQSVPSKIKKPFLLACQQTKRFYRFCAERWWRDEACVVGRSPDDGYSGHLSSLVISLAPIQPMLTRWCKTITFDQTTHSHSSQTVSACLLYTCRHKTQVWLSKREGNLKAGVWSRHSLGEWSS